MGSVMSDTECPKCKFPYAWCDYYYKSGEQYIFCDRCGFSHSVELIRDPKYGNQIKLQAEQLIKEGKIEEALKITGNTGWTRSVPLGDGKSKDVPIAEWTDEEKIKTIQDTRFNRFCKKDKDGNFVWDVKRNGGFGSYHQLSERGGGVGGHFITKWGAKKTIKEMKKFLKRHKKFKGVMTATKKINGKWYMIDLKTDKRYEIPMDIDYDLWMKYKSGRFE